MQDWLFWIGYDSGSIQGLHNVHGSYNMPTIPSSISSRNSGIGSAPGGSAHQSPGRFTGNNLSSSLAQACSFFAIFTTIYWYSYSAFSIRTPADVGDGILLMENVWNIPDYYFYFRQLPLYVCYFSKCPLPTSKEGDKLTINHQVIL